MDGSRLYEISPDLFAELEAGDEAKLTAVSRRRCMDWAPSSMTSFEDLAEPVSLSLNVAQACNLSCSYCYADEGRFGGPARMMERDVALGCDRPAARGCGRSTSHDRVHRG